MKKLSTRILFIFILTSLISTGKLSGQVTVQVLTKTMSGDEQWQPGMKLEVNGENAEIYCTSHDENTIQWEVQLIAKHPDKAIAEYDLKNLKLATGVMGKKLVLRNYIEIEKNKARPESNLKTIYHIKIPKDCPLIINNYFGKIDLENISGNLEINSEFAGISLNQVSGRTKIASTFGDINAEAISGWTDIESKRANITMTNISGTINIDASLAEIKLDEFNEITSLMLEAEKSEVIIIAENKFRWLLDFNNVEFSPPAWMKPSINENAEKTIEVNFTEMPSVPLIQISLNIGTLEIK
jgi:hypothetical protein